MRQHERTPRDYETIKVPKVSLDGIRDGISNFGMLFNPRGHLRTIRIVESAQADGLELVEAPGDGYYALTPQMASQFARHSDRDNNLHGLLEEFLGPDAVFLAHQRHYDKHEEEIRNEHYYSLKEQEKPGYTLEAAKRYVGPMAIHTREVLNRHIDNALKEQAKQDAQVTIDFEEIAAEVVVGNAMRILGDQGEQNPEFLATLARYVHKGEAVAGLEKFAKVPTFDMVKKYQYPGGIEQYYRDQEIVFQKMEQVLKENEGQMTFAGIVASALAANIKHVEENPALNPQKKESEIKRLKINAIKRLVSIIAAAGLTTLGAALSATKWMTSNPGIVEDLNGRIDNVYKPGETVTSDTLEAMPELTNMENYVLQMAPPLPNVSHKAVRSFNVINSKKQIMKVRKGEKVTIPAYALNAVRGEQPYNPHIIYDGSLAFGKVQQNIRVCAGFLSAEEEMKVYIFTLAQVAKEKGVAFQPMVPDPNLQDLESGFHALWPTDNHYRLAKAN
jgi:hypothetical protein